MIRATPESESPLMEIHRAFSEWLHKTNTFDSTPKNLQASHFAQKPGSYIFYVFDFAHIKRIWTKRIPSKCTSKYNGICTK